MNIKIVSIISVITFILFAVSFVKFYPPLEKASNAVITKESPQTAVKTTHKRGAGIGYFSRTNHVAYVNDRDWVILGPWTKDQSKWTPVQTALHNGEVVEISYAVESNMILDRIDIESWIPKPFFFSGKENAQVWSSKAKKWYHKSLKMQTILLANNKSGDMLYEFEKRDTWLNYLPFVFIIFIPLIIRMMRKNY